MPPLSVLLFVDVGGEKESERKRASERERARFMKVYLMRLLGLKKGLFEVTLLPIHYPRVHVARGYILALAAADEHEKTPGLTGSHIDTNTPYFLYSNSNYELI